MSWPAGRTEQRGFVFLAIVLVLLISGGVVLFTRLNSTSSRVAAQSAERQETLERVRDALVNFVSANGYLPCPADGTLATGLAAPAAADPTCTTSIGTVPWATLGLSTAEVIDPFQNKISYRVFSGPTGLTQANGASMANCDSVRAPLPTPQTLGADATSLCRTDHDTSPAQFLAGKGLGVTNMGTAVASVAFILISHGKNGAGAYNANGVRNDLPNVASPEYGHTQASGPFIVRAANTVELAPSDLNYFDDTVTYLTIGDLAGRAKVMARNWPDPP